MAKVIAFGQQNGRWIVHCRLPDHTGGEEEHCEVPAAALRVPEPARLPMTQMRRRVRGLIVCTLAIVGAMKAPLKALGEKVRDLRTKLDISQEVLAERCNFDRTYISLIERGQRNPSFTNLIRLAEGLKVTASDLTKGI